MRKGDTGTEISHLQRQLNGVGLSIEVDGWYGPTTQDAVAAFQQRVGLVADGEAGPKTLAALADREVSPRHLRQRHLQAAAERLGVPLATVMALNAVEALDNGFQADGRPVLQFERDALHRLLAAQVEAPALEAASTRYPALINPKRGGYAGGPAEWGRLATARQATADHPGLAEQACRWGAYQILGEHWQALGYDSIASFVAAMEKDEAAQLEAFIRLIEADPALVKALKARKWADFAKAYQVADYKEFLYDQQLARAYERFSPPEGEVA